MTPLAIWLMWFMALGLCEVETLYSDAHAHLWQLGWIVWCWLIHAALSSPTLDCFLAGC